MNAMTTKYALYVTPGKSYHDKNFEWGGYHITVAGFDSINGNKIVNDAIKNISEMSLQEKINWRPSEFKIENWKGKWTLVVNSQTLNKLSNLLKNSGVQKVKNPRFHITLPDANSREGAQKIADKLLTKKNWYLTSVMSDPVDSGNKNLNYKWSNYLPLGKM